MGRGSSTQQQTENQDSPEAIWGLQWRHIFSPKTFAEVKYTGWWGYYNLDPLVTQPLHYDAHERAYGGGAPYFYYADRTRNQVNASVSHFAEAFGNHDLKFGLEVERSTVHSRYGYNQGLYYYDNTEYYPKGQYYAYDYGYDLQGTQPAHVALRPGLLEAHRRLTINAGVRVDFVSGSSPVLDTKVYSNTNWAPRIGVAYDLTGDGKTVLKGHYGQYYDGMYFQHYAAAVPGIDDRDLRLRPRGQQVRPRRELLHGERPPLSPLYAVDPDMKHPRVDEWTVGFERALSEGLPPLRDRHLARRTRTSRAPSTRTRAGSGRPTAIDPDFPSLSGIPAPVYTWTNQSDSENTPILTNPRRASSTSTRTASRSPRPTLEEIQGGDGRARQAIHKPLAGARVLRLVRVQGLHQQQRDQHLRPEGVLFETPTRAVVNSVRPTSYDPPHEIKVNATYQIPKVEIGLNAYFRYLSGTTYTPYQRFSRRGGQLPSSTGRQPFLEPRGDRRLDDQSYLDLRVEKIFKVGGGTDRIAVYAGPPERLQPGNRHRRTALPLGLDASHLGSTVGLGPSPSRRRPRSTSRAGSCSALAGASSGPGGCCAAPPEPPARCAGVNPLRSQPVPPAAAGGRAVEARGPSRPPGSLYRPLSSPLAVGLDVHSELPDSLPVASSEKPGPRFGQATRIARPTLAAR